MWQKIDKKIPKMSTKNHMCIKILFWLKKMNISIIMLIC